MIERLPFNSWSIKRIKEGKKFCTSRKKDYSLDERVIGTVQLPWGFIRDRLYMVEGADFPEEIQRVINKIFRRTVKDNELFWVHFGDFRKGYKNER